MKGGDCHGGVNICWEVFPLDNYTNEYTPYSDIFSEEGGGGGGRQADRVLVRISKMPVQNSNFKISALQI